MNMLTWWGTEGAANRLLSDGSVYGTSLATKPAFTFSYSTLRYSDRASEYVVDGKPMTAAQQAEVLVAIQNIEPPLDWLRSMKQAEIMAAYQRAAAALVQEPIDAFEMASWGTQEAQARAVLANAAASAPMIESLRIARGKGETAVQLAQKVVFAAEAYAAAYTPILGKRQAAIAAIAAATTSAEIDAVTWV
jgi:Xaa-Pro aminopeptidase